MFDNLTPNFNQSAPNSYPNSAPLQPNPSQYQPQPAYQPGQELNTGRVSPLRPINPTPAPERPSINQTPVHGSSAEQNSYSPIDDIFAKTDNPYGQPRFGHPGPNPAGNRMLPIKGDYGKHINMAVFIIPILIVAVIALIVVASWLVYNKVKPANNQINNNSVLNKINTDLNKTNNQAPVNSSINSQTPIGQMSSSTVEQKLNNNSSTQSNTNIVQPVSSSSSTIGSVPTSSVVSTKDTDSDGLTDVAEEISGTSPLKADTDNDGLNDYAEVKIYNTNPLNPDTDGDTYKDGAEVIAGFDPSKAGGAKLVN